MTLTAVWKFFAAVMAVLMIMALGAGVITPGRAEAATLEVGPGKTYTTISLAITAASPGDTINVSASTYSEKVIINKANLSLQSVSGKDSTFIDGGGVTGTIVSITASGVTFDGFTVQNAIGTTVDGIDMTGVTGCTIKNSIIKNITGSVNAYGLHLTSSNTNTFSNITISNINQSPYVNMRVVCGVALALSDSNTFTDTIISGLTSASDAHGIFLMNSVDGNSFLRTTISNVICTDIVGQYGYSVGVTIWSRTNSCNNNIFTDTTISNVSDLDNGADGWAAGIQVRGDDSGEPVNTGNTFTNTIISNVSSSGYTYAVAVTTGSSVTFNGGSIANITATGGLADSARGFSIWKETSDASAATITNMTISVGAGLGVAVRTGVNANLTSIQSSIITGNTVYGIKNTGTGVVNAADNWWGSNTGPGPVGPGNGDKVSTNVTYSPWTLRNVPIQVTSPAGQITVASSAGTLDLATDTAVNNFSMEGLLPLAEMPYGVISFTVSNLTPGATVTMTFTLPTVPPANLEFWKYIHGAWVDCSSLLSGVADGNNTVFVTIRDGGLGDADGLANGVIVDPCTFVVPLLPALLYNQQSHGSSMAVTTPQAPVSLPNIQIQSAGLSATAVTPGTPITITADISNTGAVNGSKKVTLYVNGQVETTQGVAVNSGGSAKLAFNVSRSEPGDYTVYVDGVPAGSFKVELVTGNDALFILLAVLIGITFVFGLVTLWRRQRTGYS